MIQLLSKLRTLKYYADMALALGADWRTKLRLALLLPLVKWDQFRKTADLTKRPFRLHIMSRKMRVFLRPQDVFIVREVIYERCYAMRSTEWGTPTCIVDLGAHIGLASLYFHSVFPDAAIHAFEPTNVNGELLRDNVGQIPNLTIYPVAVGSKSGTAVIYVLPQRLAGHSLLSSTKTAGGYEQACQVVVLDEILEQATSQTVLVKFDIEGMESEVFSASKRIHDVAYIVGEVKCSRESLAEFIRLFPHHTSEQVEVGRNTYVLHFTRKRVGGG